jgi:putative addiction module component (TIGR02574 family)
MQVLRRMGRKSRSDLGGASERRISRRLDSDGSVMMSEKEIHMSEVINQLLGQIRGLSEEDRVELAYAVLRTLPEDPNVEEAWTEEILKRAAQMESGETVGIPAEEVHAEWRNRRK